MEGKVSDMAVSAGNSEQLRCELEKIQAFLGKYDLDLMEANRERSVLLDENQQLRGDLKTVRSQQVSAHVTPTKDLDKDSLVRNLKKAKGQITSLQEEYDTAYAKLKSNFDR